MPAVIVTSQHSERPGAAAAVSYARFVSDAPGYRIENTGTEALIFTADGAGLQLTTAGIRAANLVRLGDSYFISEIT